MERKRSILTKILRCPVCSSDVYVSEDGKSLYCCGRKRHCFDFSADGYVNLARQGMGDTKGAVNARRSFLSKDYYLPVADKLCGLVGKYAGGDAIVIDAGCGEGYYTNKLAKNELFVFGFDLSKYGIAAAAKAARRNGADNTFYSVASIFELPVKDKSVDCAVNIFAPCAEEEYLRVLKNEGILIVVGAGREHLWGLKNILYDNIYENNERADLPVTAELVEHVTEKYDIELNSQEDIDNLFSMTPYYWRTSESDKEKLRNIGRMKTTVEFEFYIYGNKKYGKAL